MRAPGQVLIFGSMTVIILRVERDDKCHAFILDHAFPQFVGKILEFTVDYVDWERVV